MDETARVLVMMFGSAVMFLLGAVIGMLIAYRKVNALIDAMYERIEFLELVLRNIKSEHETPLNSGKR